jgi:hypothetical protein
MSRLARIAAAPALAVLAGSWLAAQAPARRQDAALRPEQIRALVLKAIALQHKNEAALLEYERTERRIDRGEDEVADRTSRVVPTGPNFMRVELERNGQKASPEKIAEGWRGVAENLELKIQRDDPRVKKDYERAEERRRETAKMLDAVGEAFHFRWAGRETHRGRPVIVLNFEPDAGYQPPTRYATIYKQLWGKAWVDESSGQVMRLEAELRRDVSFIGGIVAKIYKGSRLELEQAEVAPGTWLPTRHFFDINFRRFLFRSALHRTLEARDYRRVGRPNETLALIRREHAAAMAP